MNAKLGMIAYEEELHPLLPVPAAISSERRYSATSAREIYCAVRDSVQEAYQGALRILAHARSVLEEGARLLLEKETLAEPDLQALRKALEAAKPLPDVARIDRMAS